MPDIAYRRSLRASHRRRAAALRARRRGVRARSMAFGASAVMALSGGAAMAAPTVSAARGAAVLQAGAQGAGVRALQRALGVRADGQFGPATERAVRRYQRHHDLVVDGVAGPRTLSALGLAAVAQTNATAAGATHASRALDPRLARIAQCESGGDPQAVSPGGTYRGKYQFDRPTWGSVGGHGDPAAAPEREQDRRAGTLLAQRGTAPWGACAGG